jgi:peptidoglycan hydrolase-like protein with peptidoglycan-binding domain
LKQRVWIEILSLLVAGVVLFGATTATTTTASKKKKSTTPKTAAKKTTASTKRRAVTKKPTVASWRSTQRTPTAERYKEIQEALASKGYLQSGGPNGVWDNSSVEALKKFQEDQNLEPSGKLDSLSLIALGLGPKHDQPPSPNP